MYRLPLAIAAVFTFAACSSDSDSTSPISEDGECRMLTVTDVSEVTGVSVHVVPRGSIDGAGGTCANFATSDDRAFLGINSIASQAEFDAHIDAIPADIYPTKQSVSGIGDEALLFTNQFGNLHYLIVRKGSGGAAIFPIVPNTISIDEVKELGVRAMDAN